MSNTGKGNIQMWPLVCDPGSVETAGKSGVTADVAEAIAQLCVKHWGSLPGPVEH